MVRGACSHHWVTPVPLSLDHWPVSVCYVTSCHVMSCEHMYFINMTVTLFTASSLGLNMHVFGTETHMTAIVGMALGKREIPKPVGFDSNAAANMFFNAQNKVRAWLVKTSLSSPVKSFSLDCQTSFGFVLLLLVIAYKFRPTFSAFLSLSKLNILYTRAKKTKCQMGPKFGKCEPWDIRPCTLEEVRFWSANKTSFSQISLSRLGKGVQFFVLCFDLC